MSHMHGHPCTESWPSDTFEQSLMCCLVAMVMTWRRKQDTNSDVNRWLLSHPSGQQTEPEHLNEISQYPKHTVDQQYQEWQATHPTSIIIPFGQLELHTYIWFSFAKYRFNQLFGSWSRRCSKCRKRNSDATHHAHVVRVHLRTSRLQLMRITDSSAQFVLRYSVRHRISDIDIRSTIQQHSYEQHSYEEHTFNHYRYQHSFNHLHCRCTILCGIHDSRTQSSQCQKTWTLSWRTAHEEWIEWERSHEQLDQELEPINDDESHAMIDTTRTITCLIKPSVDW